MFHLIDGPVGPGEENDPDNLRILWAGLNALDKRYRDPDEFPPLITSEFEDATRTFQVRHGLSQDGRWIPGGETERNLIARLSGDGFDRVNPSDVRLRGSIGNGGENRPEDVVTGKRIFASLGKYEYDRTRSPTPFVDTPFVDAIRDFQRRYGLPDTGLIDLDSDELKELGLEVRDLESKSRQEIQVAVLPILAIALVAARFGWAASRVVAARRAGNMAVKRAVRQAEKEISDGPMINVPPNPGDLGGSRTPDHHEPPDFDKRPLVHPIPDSAIEWPETFPLPVDPSDFVEVFPDQGDIWLLPVVRRKGKEETRVYNTEIARFVEEIAKECGIELEHYKGARDDRGNEKKEFYMPNRKPRGRKGSNFLDITFRLLVDGVERFLHFNTVDTLADGITRTKREEDAAGRIMNNKKKRDFLVLIQKLRNNETLDKDGVKKLVKPILEEMSGKPWKGHKNKRPSSEIYHDLKKRGARLQWHAVA